MTARAACAFVFASAIGASITHAEPVIQPIENAVTDAFPAEDVVLPANGFGFFFGIGAGDPGLRHGANFVDLADRTRNAFVVNPRDLVPPPAPGTSFTLTASCPGCDLVRTWTMGEEDDTEPPVVDDVPVTQASFTKTTGASAAYVSRIVVPPIDDAQPRLILLTDNENGTRDLFPASRAAETVVDHEFGTALDATGEHCVDIDALDTSRNTTRVATHCVALEDAVDVTEPGCASTSPTLVSALAAMLLLLRRRAAR